MATKATKTPVKKTKKPAAKKPVSAKTTTKSVAKKTAPKTMEVVKKDRENETKSTSTNIRTSSSRRELTPLEKVRSLHFSSFISYILLSILSIFLIGQASSEALLTYQAKDSFLSGNTVVLGTASEVLFSVEYRYVLMASLVIGAIGSLLLATKLRKRYEVSLAASVSGFRWLLIGVTSALLVELASFMGGIQDLMTLKVVAALVLAGAVFGWLAERENRGIGPAHKLPFYASIVAYLAAFLPLIGSAVGTFIYGNQRFSWYVYAFAAVALAGLLATVWLQRSAIKNKAKYDYLVFEQRYLRLDQIVKFLSVLILLAALR